MTQYRSNRPLHYLSLFLLLTFLHRPSADTLSDSYWQDPSRLLPGGATSAPHRNDQNAFSHFANNLTLADELTFKLGNALFRKVWVKSPASTQASDGLGPLYNARACQRCHIKDGRGKPPEVLGKGGHSALLRLSRQDEQGNIGPDPNYGGQLQPFAVSGILGEAAFVQRYTPIHYLEIPLQKPIVDLTNWNYGPLDKHTKVSLRVAPPMIGLGLLEAIAREDLIAQADPDDQNNDGISGRIAQLANGQTGRFGWKALNPTVRTQSAGAFSGDMGLSTTLHPNPAGDCRPSQELCIHAPHGADKDGVEISDQMLDFVTFYSSHLAPPARPNALDAEIIAGEKIFHQIGCHQCHTPRYKTRADATFPALAAQTIWPYTDLLLHDMGDALADRVAEGAATGREWRTPPLWGLGRTQVVSGHTRLLHDGRAANISEAIYWHAGEALKSREQYRALDSEDLKLLMLFLHSL